MLLWPISTSGGGEGPVSLPRGRFDGSVVCDACSAQRAAVQFSVAPEISVSVELSDSGTAHFGAAVSRREVG
jgi:hypothetical protein